MPEGLTQERVGLRERKRQQTELELRAAALKLFTERGFDHVTIDEIAEAAVVSRRTFYRYFESKEDVLLGRATEKLEYIRAALAEQPADLPALAAVRNAILALADRYEIERDERLAMRRLLHETPSLAARNVEHQIAWETLLCEFLAQRLGDDADGLRSRVLAANVTSTVRAAIDAWTDAGGESDLHTVVTDALQILAEGLPG